MRNKIFKLKPGQQLVELSRKSYSEPDYLEDFLQELIFKYPEIIAEECKDTGFWPLIPLGREIGVENGSIDCLFVTPLGRLVIIEVKRWKNPEALRLVLSQIIDYSRCLSNSSYEQLQQYCRTANLYKTVIANCPQHVNLPEESVFVEQVSDCLEKSDFMLIIAGDGIRKPLEELVEIMKQYPHLYTKFVLVELLMYQEGKEVIIVTSKPAESVQFEKLTIEMPTILRKTNVIKFSKMETSQKTETGSRRKLKLEDLYEEMSGQINDTIVNKLAVIMREFENIGCHFEGLSASINVMYKKTGLLTIYNNGKIFFSYKQNSIYQREDLREIRKKLFDIFPTEKYDYNELGSVEKLISLEAEVLKLIAEAIKIIDRREGNS